MDNIFPARIPSAHSAKTGPSEAQPEPALAGGKKESIFQLEAAGAKQVFLAGEFTDWEKSPIKMTKGRRGVWQTTVALAPGRHRYRFLVDGVWRDDPKARHRVPIPYGSCDEVIEIS